MPLEGKLCTCELLLAMQTLTQSSATQVCFIHVSSIRACMHAQPSLMARRIYRYLLGKQTQQLLRFQKSSADVERECISSFRKRKFCFSRENARHVRMPCRYATHKSHYVTIGSYPSSHCRQTFLSACFPFFKVCVVFAFKSIYAFCINHVLATSKSIACLYQ